MPETCPRCKRFKVRNKPCKMCGIIVDEKKEPLMPVWLWCTIAGWVMFGGLIVWRLLQNAH